MSNQPKEALPDSKMSFKFKTNMKEAEKSIEARRHKEKEMAKQVFIKEWQKWMWDEEWKRKMLAEQAIED